MFCDVEACCMSSNQGGRAVCWHAAEEWNELHHLQIMESLGGDELWVDRSVAAAGAACGSRLRQSRICMAVASQQDHPEPLKPSCFHAQIPGAACECGVLLDPAGVFLVQSRDGEGRLPLNPKP